MALRQSVAGFLCIAATGGSLEPPHHYEWHYECSGYGFLTAEGAGGLARRVVIPEAGASCTYDGILVFECETPPAAASGAYTSEAGGNQKGYPCHPDILGYYQQICVNLPTKTRVCARGTIQAYNEPQLGGIQSSTDVKQLSDFGTFCTQEVTLDFSRV